MPVGYMVTRNPAKTRGTMQLTSGSIRCKKARGKNPTKKMETIFQNVGKAPMLEGPVDISDAS